jgi:16S rRNA (guanine(966)-N(2))-methyltransferase RsmD
MIPSHRALANIRLTSSRLKEAIFSMLGPGLQDRTFLDLCAGSGQIGLEALSRGARVTFNEPDRRRCFQLRSLLKQWRAPRAEVHSAKAQVFIPQLRVLQRRFAVIYLDPPYHATRAARPLSVGLLEQLADGLLLDPDGLLLVQHQSSLDLPRAYARLGLVERRPYGSTALSIYCLGPVPEPV